MRIFINALCYLSVIKFKHKKYTWSLNLFVCLPSMKYPVMAMHQMMFSSQYHSLTLTWSLFYWRTRISLGKLLHNVPVFNVGLNPLTFLLCDQIPKTGFQNIQTESNICHQHYTETVLCLLLHFSNMLLLLVTCVM